MSRTSVERMQERSDWLERAEAVCPSIERYADASAEARRMVPELVETLHDADLFAMASPREVGGFDVHPATQVEAFEQMASVDVSSGWVAMIQAETPGMAGSHLSDGVGLDTVFGGRFPKIAGTANPEGRAVSLGGGDFRISGRWSYASGIQHCDWVLANSVVVNEAGQPIGRDQGIPPMIGCVVERSKLIVEDSWHVMGLEGTGSCHYRAEDVDVTAPFTTPFGGVHAFRGGPWFELPTITFLSPGHTGIALGSAKRALQLLHDQVGSRVRFGASVAIADRGAFQRDYGEMCCRYEAARAYALSVLEGAMAHRESGGEITPDFDARIRAMVTFVTDTCVAVAHFAHHTGGGAAAFLDHPLQRVLRDILMASQHVYVADSAYERTGALRLGREPSSVL